ncbi:insulinase family protein, partial [Sphingomonas sp.]|uniref:insulinase family protein n=1 Tax=Sphingomonas sp. TaxID=28214 RepID=UPI0025FBAFFD
VRERLGDSYGVNVASNQSSTFTGYGYLSVAAVVAPGKVDEVQKAIADAAAELRDKPISSDLLDRARNPDLDKADQAMRDNGFWLTVLARAQSKPDRLDRIRQLKSLLQSTTPADLQALARKYLRPDQVQDVRIVSSKAVTTASR